MNKTSLRKQTIAKRQSMTTAEINTASNLIQDIVIEHLEKVKPKSVHVYTSIEKNKEVSTEKIINYLKDCEYVVSAHTFMYLDSQWKNVTILGANEKLDYIDYDEIIVPMLAGDGQGNRLGYGSGFYDKFLATQKQAYKIGLCFKNSVVEKLPSESHDIKMDEVLTEKD